MGLIRSRDPSGRGLPSVAALRLLMALLHWNPAARPTPEEVPCSYHLFIMQSAFDGACMRTACAVLWES